MNSTWKNILFIVSLPLLFLAGYAIRVDHSGKNSQINVEVAPSSATISIDGRQVSAGVNRVVSGHHGVKVNLMGFATQTQTVNTSPGATSYVGVVLQPDSANSNWYANHTADQKLAEQISSHLNDYQSQQATQSNSILQVLPVTFSNGSGGFINIASGIPLYGSSEPAVYITAASVADRQTALAWIKNRGYNPAQMDLVFYGENNGLSLEGE